MSYSCFSGSHWWTLVHGHVFIFSAYFPFKNRSSTLHCNFFMFMWFHSHWFPTWLWDRNHPQTSQNSWLWPEWLIWWESCDPTQPNKNLLWNFPRAIKNILELGAGIRSCKNDMGLGATGNYCHIEKVSCKRRQVETSRVVVKS